MNRSNLRASSEDIARNFSRDRTSIHSSLKFITKKHGQKLFGYQDSGEHHDKISRALHFMGGLADLFELIQRDLQSISFNPCWFSTGFATQPERVVCAGFERLKSGCQLKLLLLRDPISGLVVLEFVLEVLAHGPHIPRDSLSKNDGVARNQKSSVLP